jgi:hypothetical protein
MAANGPLAEEERRTHFSIRLIRGDQGRDAKLGRCQSAALRATADLS